MIRREIIKIIQKATGLPWEEIKIGHPEVASFGDYSSNVALRLKKPAVEIVGKLKSDLFEKIEVAGPGFINFFISPKYLQKQVAEILKQGEKFGQLKIGKNQKVNVEFISANPTGPLTLGNGRGGFCGDVLANILEKAGHKVSREYYINDRGEQVVKLGHSVLADEQAVYKGKYIDDLRQRISGKTPEDVGEKAAGIILKEMIKPAVKKMGIKFDVWFSEKSLYKESEIKQVLDYLKKKNLLYEKDRAFWFKSTQFGDDKDRVLVKEDGEETYFLSDIAYLNNKFHRGFNRLIFFWGADHYGYIARLKAAAEALGFGKEKLVIIIMQLVQLFQEGKEVRMSKRTGAYVTLDELIDEAGLDVSRFFFLTRSPGSHLNFDLDLAKEQSEKNPVYYVQYAHARICSILQKSTHLNNFAMTGLLRHESELNLIKQLIRLPEIIDDTARDYQVQRLPQYAMDLAAAFHQFYRDCKVLRPSSEPQSNSEVEGLQKARLTLVSAAKIVLKNTLDLMGISAPEKM